MLRELITLQYSVAADRLDSVISRAAPSMFSKTEPAELVSRAASRPPQGNPQPCRIECIAELGKHGAHALLEMLCVGAANLALRPHAQLAHLRKIRTGTLHAFGLGAGLRSKSKADGASSVLANDLRKASLRAKASCAALSETSKTDLKASPLALAAGGFLQIEDGVHGKLLA